MEMFYHFGTKRVTHACGERRCAFPSCKAGTVPGGKVQRLPPEGRAPLNKASNPYLEKHQAGLTTGNAVRRTHLWWTALRFSTLRIVVVLSRNPFEKTKA
jgi:hypothetical protein